MKPIVQTYEVKATPTQVFDALTNPATIQQWSGGPAQMDNKVGTNFSLFGGGVHGTNLEVIPNQKLVQEWYAEELEQPSKVSFTLVPTGEGTIIELLHEGVPEGQIQKFSEGWKQHYLGQIQKMFAG
jgi:uncharacterized protein YndB with AHSA1/START domain